MGIIAMLVVMSQRGMPGSVPFGIGVAIVVAISALLAGLFLKDTESA
jgi:hypothetical protein